MNGNEHNIGLVRELLQNKITQTSGFLLLIIFSLIWSRTLVTTVKPATTLSSNQTAGASPAVSPDIPSPQIAASAALATHPASLAMEKFKVSRVIDGDTIEIAGGRRVRYIGIDTPETVDPRKPIQCFGQEASAKNKELVEGKEVGLEKDISETDKYGRLLRYVYLQDLLVNDYLVRQGYAHASSYPPDIKYQDQLHQAEQEARQAQRGLWGSACQKSPGDSLLLLTTPSVSDSANPQISPTSCQIKGNISSSGEKIYHLPGQRYYDKTIIDTNKGERWFCTEQGAISAGWRKSKV